MELDWIFMSLSSTQSHSICSPPLHLYINIQRRRRRRRNRSTEGEIRASSPLTLDQICAYRPISRFFYSSNMLLFSFGNDCLIIIIISLYSLIWLIGYYLIRFTLEMKGNLCDVLSGAVGSNSRKKMYYWRHEKVSQEKKRSAITYTMRLVVVIW